MMNGATSILIVVIVVVVVIAGLCLTRAILSHVWVDFGSREHNENTCIDQIIKCNTIEMYEKRARCPFIPERRIQGKCSNASSSSSSSYDDDDRDDDDQN